VPKGPPEGVGIKKQEFAACQTDWMFSTSASLEHFAAGCGVLKNC
jgi:hypothetical protein